MPILDALRAEDIPAVHAAYNDPIALQSMNIPDPFTETHAAGLIRPEVFAIRDAPGLPLLGTIALRGAPPTGDIGGITLTPEARGRGIATTAVEMLMQRAWDNGYTTLEWECLVVNAKSIALAERCGFIFQREVVSSSELERHKDKLAWVGVIRKP